MYEDGTAEANAFGCCCAYCCRCAGAKPFEEGVCAACACEPAPLRLPIMSSGTGPAAPPKMDSPAVDLPPGGAWMRVLCNISG